MESHELIFSVWTNAIAGTVHNDRITNTLVSWFIYSRKQMYSVTHLNHDLTLGVVLTYPFGGDAVWSLGINRNREYKDKKYI